jgi:hypothetical protein
MDAGLIDINDVNDWTAKLQDGTVMGPMLDLSAANFSMSLLGGHVRGHRASSGRWIRGEIQALFYRYKSKGGFEYVSDFFIGARTPTSEDPSPPRISLRCPAIWARSGSWNQLQTRTTSTAHIPQIYSDHLRSSGARIGCIQD